MANAIYPFARAEIARGNIDLINDTIKAIFIDAADETYNSADQDIADIGAGAMIGSGGGTTGDTGATIANISISDAAVVDGDDVTLTSVSAGADEFEVVLIYKWTGSAATSTLIAWLDTGTGMTQDPDGGNIDITWNGSGILQL